MFTHKITPSIDYNYWLKHLDAKLIVTTNQNSIKVPKVVKKKNKKLYYKTLGSCLINGKLSPSFLINYNNNLCGVT